MDTERDHDPDTTGDHDETTLDGSEGLDADAISTDGEDLPAQAPEGWVPPEDDETLDERLRAERPDVGAAGAGTAGVRDPGDDDERRDAIDELDTEGDPRVLGED